MPLRAALVAQLLSSIQRRRKDAWYVFVSLLLLLPLTKIAQEAPPPSYTDVENS